MAETALYLPKLNNLTPTLESTLLKAIEEAGELARAVLAFLPYEELRAADLAGRPDAAALLGDVSGELLDVAQTCVTMFFVLEEDFGIDADGLIGSHLEKLTAKGYAFDRNQIYRVRTLGNFKCLQLPRLDIQGVTLLKTVCKVQEELGELTQFMGKGSGASGEDGRLPARAVVLGAALELLDVAQCCFTMMYILADRFQVDIDGLAAAHVAKLQSKGYCACRTPVHAYPGGE